jgi:hypothetical protein
MRLKDRGVKLPVVVANLPVCMSAMFSQSKILADGIVLF